MQVNAARAACGDGDIDFVHRRMRRTRSSLLSSVSAHQVMKQLLHVGCGLLRKEHTTSGFNTLDMLYGHREAMARGNLFMAHRCGFTRKAQADSLLSAGFKAVAAIARPRSFDLCAVASKSDRSEAQMRALARTHFPA